MAKYEIHDIEICKKVVVDAPGMLEAISDYLPWPTLQLTCDYQPTNGKATFIDKSTEFMYIVTVV